MTTPERQPGGHEAKTGSTEQAAAERAAELLRQHEKAGEVHNESEAKKSVEKAREDAEKEALSVEEGPKAEKHTPSVENKQITTAGASRKEAYDKTMKRVQSELSPAARVFSKVIHNPVIERTSEVVGDTLARPNAILSGSITAFVLVLAVYTLARHLGFSLSGFETIAAFVIGWVLGILFDFFRVMITGKKR